MKLKTFIKNISLLFIICFSFNNAKAQWVTIPDPNFVNYLNLIFPTCMNGNLMDTTCLDIQNASYLDLNSVFPVSDLYGIQFFKNLDSLELSDQNLTTIPPLPNTIKKLDYSHNDLLTSIGNLPDSLEDLYCGWNTSLGSLPVLPSSLKKLSCPWNGLTSLPVLPAGLQFLNCGQNPINNLPALPSTIIEMHCNNCSLDNLPALPSALELLSCGNNSIDYLPALPNSLTKLYCSGNGLLSLPALPSALTLLNCGINQLSNLPTLPSSLMHLSCNNNNLTSLPSFPNSLKDLACWENLLTSLPSFPASLKGFNCSSNLLTELPVLPDSLTDLRCDYNNITCFGEFPSSLLNPSNFNISNNPFYCLPNYVSAMNAATLAYPLCIANNVSNNPNNCPDARGIIGTVYEESNNNCTIDSSEFSVVNIPVRLYNTASVLLAQTYTLSNGYYNFARPAGAYIVKIDTANAPFAVTCTNIGVDYLVVLNAAQPLASNINFPITCDPGFDLGVQSITGQGFVFPGVTHQLNILAGDLSHWYGLHCASGISGELILDITGPITYAGVTNGALTPIIAGNTYTYSIADFGNITIDSAFGLQFLVDTTATAADQICVTATITPTNGDVNINNNTHTFCYDVTNSFDPNKKETYPENVGPGYNDYLTYTIHFQNTGNAPAMNIHIEDTLDANLNLNTFELINYSHANSTWITGNKLSFNFPNIQLPDSGSNQQASQGFIQYRIKPLNNLPNGTTIHNRASIFFDFNAPIVTNTTENIFGSVVTNTRSSLYSVSTLKVQPNPSKDIITLSNVINNGLITIMNITGNQVIQTNLNNSKTININNLPSGIYFIQALTNDGLQSAKFVKE